MSNEDQRAAISLKVSLSSTLMAVALGFIGAEAAIVTFVLDKREHLLWFYICAAASIVFLTMSGITAGKGISAMYRSGFDQSWRCEDDGMFNAQALTLLFGIVFVCVSAFLGTPKPPSESNATAKIEVLEQRIKLLEERVVGLQLPSPPATPKNDRGNQNQRDRRKHGTRSR